MQPYREGLDALAKHYKEILTLLGEDPEREGLLKTPMRVAKAMQTLTRGYEMDAHKVLTDALWLISPTDISPDSPRLPVSLTSSPIGCKCRSV